jgi:hypothetical protein
VCSFSRKVPNLVAGDRRQARTIFRYVRGLLMNVPMLKRLVVAERAIIAQLGLEPTCLRMRSIGSTSPMTPENHWTG